MRTTTGKATRYQGNHRERHLNAIAEVYATLKIRKPFIPDHERANYLDALNALADAIELEIDRVEKMPAPVNTDRNIVG